MAHLRFHEIIKRPRTSKWETGQLKYIPDTRILSRRSFQDLWKPLLVLSFSAIVLFGLWISLGTLQTARLRTSIDVTAEQVEMRLESWVQTRLDLVEFFGRSSSERKAIEPEGFRSQARQYIEAAPDFQAINWIDPDWTVQVVEPEEGNRPILGFNMREHPSQGVVEALSAAERTGRIHRSPTVDLVQGGTGFATYSPVLNADGSIRGFINGVFRIDTLVESCLAEESLRTQFRYAIVEADGRLAYAHGSITPDEDGPLVVRREIDIPDHPWTLVMAPTAELSASADAFQHGMLIATGIVLALLLAWTMHTSAKRQSALQQSEARYRLLVENQTDLVIELDREGRFEFASPSYCETFDLTEEELLGHNIIRLIEEEQREQTARAMVEILSPPYSIYLEQRSLTKYGHRWFGWVGTAVLDQNSEVTGIIAVGRDITKLKSLEESLLQSQKMEAIGQLAGGVAHDFNNILQVIRGHLDLAQGELTPDHTSAVHLSEVRHSADRAADLIRQLLAFGRRQVLQPEFLDLREQAKITVGLLERIIGEQITFELVLDAEPRIVHVDPQQIEQVLMNLCFNARDAMPDGGRVTISVHSRYLDERECKAKKCEQPGTFATITVHDTGIGMDEPTLGQIFEPFFTTKPLGKGSGLGLATVFGIIRQHEGLIEVESAPNEGSQFTIFLPMVDDPGLQQPEVEALDTPGGTENILLAEDDPAVCSVIEQILSEAGYRVVSAPNGNKAIEILERNEDKFCLAILDVVMPGAGGLEVADYIRNSKVPTKVLLTSGYSLDLARATVGDDVPLLAKPFRRGELLRMVRKLLDHS